MASKRCSQTQRPPWRPTNPKLLRCAHHRQPQSLIHWHSAEGERSERAPEYSASTSEKLLPGSHFERADRGRSAAAGRGRGGVAAGSGASGGGGRGTRSSCRWVCTRRGVVGWLVGVVLCWEERGVGGWWHSVVYAEWSS